MIKMSKDNDYTDEELLSILKQYSIEQEFPTQRKFKKSCGLPCSVTYFNRFGSFKNAILMAGIEIPEDRLRFFNRSEYSRSQ
jgi:hypothetical protein